MTETSAPHRRRHARTRQAILDAARQIIAERGADGLSMRELADRIDYSPSGLYEYFHSKDELIATLCGEGFDALAQRLQAAQEIPGASASERVVAVGLAYIAFGAENPDRYKLMFNSRPPIPLSLEMVATGASFGVLVQVVRDGVEAGEFRGGTGYGALEQAYYLWALVHGQVMLGLAQFYGSPTGFAALNQRVLEEAVVGLRA
ncbi:MAG: TetR/AcrR family transcriptional regulator [Anaerolineae bacterium]